MTRLFLAGDGERAVWVVALIDEEIWTYVANTGMFHKNQAMRDDFFVGSDFTYTEIGVREAARAIADGVGLLDEEKSTVPLRTWRADSSPLPPETVFASATADLD
ncbi:hypothetical protein EV643_12268 [Kribbella sp. VKM Ac-2527]|uniref:Uncharacterized protein n=1 Tax=Kribbella caucasensis TaxID=2512215 RepID=A0A4R6JJ48_9ACTN|nr:hypothetical protein [Kribbella sp. VKM Ac-2527]TDO35657.1 hypothetical protein EV643_12268 [Kribbella sp. VKM Ac-2527]